MGNRQPISTVNNPQAQNLLGPNIADSINNSSVLIQDQTMTPTPTLLEQVHIRGDSLKVISENANAFSLSFTFDALTDCSVSLYFFAIETLTSSGVTDCYFVDTARYPSPCTHSFKAGLDQKFPEALGTFDVNKYSNDELAMMDGKTYPLVIEIVIFT